MAVSGLIFEHTLILFHFGLIPKIHQNNSIIMGIYFSYSIAEITSES